MASGKQAGSGPARPHLQSMPFREPGARVRAPAIVPVITQYPPQRRHRAHPAQSSLLGTPGHLARAPLASTVAVPRHLPGAAAGPTPAAASSLCPATCASRAEPTLHRQASTAKPLRPPPGPIPATNAPAATAIRAPHTDQSTSGCIDILPNGPGCTIRSASPGQRSHVTATSRPCGSRSGSTPNRTSACHPLCVRHGCYLRGIGMDLLSAR